MKHRLVAMLVTAGLLGGCSSSLLDNALEFPSTADRRDTQAEASVPDSPAPATVAVAGTAPFVTVPEAPPLGSTDQQHESLRAGTAPPTPVVVQPKVAAAPLDDAMLAPRPAPPARSAMVAPPLAPPVARTPPAAPVTEPAEITPPVARPAARVPAPVAVASVPPVARTVTPPPAAQPAPAAVAQPSYTPPAAPQPSYAPAPTTVAQASAAPSGDLASAPDSWCVRVAKSAQVEAAEQGFDAATQQRRAIATFKQCSSNAH